MKKLMVLAALVLGFATAKADCYWSTWYDDGVNGKDVKGCVLGLASDIGSLTGAQIDICINKAKAIRGGAQVSFGYNRTEKLRNGVQLGFWNNAKSSALQIGLINHNETGFLPWFPFFNFDTKMFGND